MTKVLAAHSDYILLDFLAHDSAEEMESLEKEIGRQIWVNQDWYEYDGGEFDIVIANDIFPDVDQRLELFINKYLPRCKEVRLLVTYYNEPRYYTTKRIDDTEILTFLSWDGEITALKLKKYLNQLDISELELNNMKTDKSSIYHNGRQVCYVKIQGNLAAMGK